MLFYLMHAWICLICMIVFISISIIYVLYLSVLSILSYDYRRQGVGMKLVRIGLKIAEKWDYNKLYVAVESNNSNAINMYNKLNFVCVMKEEDNINRKIDRVPRIFLAVDITKKVVV